jgi:acyl-homoserine-lactone acylase
LFRAYKAAPDSVKKSLAAPIQTLQQWDKRTAAGSEATTLAIEWGTLMMRAVPSVKTTEESTFQTTRVESMLRNISDKRLLDYLTAALNDLQKRYGSWKIKWGDINRYQRPADGITFSDTAPSLPVGLTSSLFGQLPSFVSRPMNTQKRYGYSGNSFIAAVEFGTRIKAKTVETGGESFDPASKHYTDQAGMYIEGKFKDVLFYKKDVLKHAEKTYHPGT